MLQTVNTIFAKINKCVCWIIALMLQGVVVMVVLQVFCRFVIMSTLEWTEEISRFCFIWLCMLGFSVCVYEKSNLGIEFLYNRLPCAGKKAFTLIIQVLLLILFGIMTYYGFQLTKIVSMQTSASLGYNMAWSYSSVMVGSALSLMYTVVNLIELLSSNERGTA